MARDDSGLLGRRSECEVLDRLVASVRAGRSQVLVLRGEAGAGKSALLEYLFEGASECRIARAAGVESEMELPFAGLHQLCAPMLGRLGSLPGPQRDALGTAFGLSAGQPPDRFLVGLAVLSLLADVAEEQPLVCLVDDAQWLDQVSAQTLGFVARRLLAERVAVVFALRAPDDEHTLRGLPELIVEGLSDGDARVLLDSAIRAPVDEQVRDRIVAETRGNPLALLEFPRGLTPAQLAGGFGLPHVMPLTSRIEQSFVRRLESLPIETRRLLLVAAAEPVGDVALLWRAAEHLGFGPDAASPAQTAGLIELGTRVRFRHPLARSAVYRSMSAQERRDVHHALGVATDSSLDPDRRAWHHAHAAVGPDEAVACELERSASRVQRRGGVAAAAAFLEWATSLTPDPVQRGRRALAAAQAKLQAGAFDPALDLLATAQAGPLDDLQRAQMDVLQAEIAFASSRGNEATPLLLAAARQLEPLAAGLARETYLDAFSAAMFAGRLASGADSREVAHVAQRVPPPSQTSLRSDLLLDALTVLFTGGYAAAVPIARRTLQAFRGEDLSPQEGLRWLWLASALAADLWDDESWYVLSTLHVKFARESGALSELPLALNSRVVVHLFAGELTAAASLVEEAQAVKEVTGTDLAPYGALGLAALRGREGQAAELIEDTMSEVMARGEGIGVTVARWASAVLSNGLRRYGDALTAARSAAEFGQELAVSNWGLVELIEAAALSGMTEVALDALQRLSEMTRVSGTDWALGIEARSRALVIEGPAADALYREAIERLGSSRIVVHLARAHLLYGEWLRRTGRRDDAREQLRRAHEMLTTIGAEAFADRARRELLATGETVRTSSVETLDELTAQETQIARMAAAGQTNPEIGAQLFISPRTVEYHLRKVFAKLGIRSRKELGSALPGAGRATMLI